MGFYGISDFPAFLIGTILIVLLPGPNSLFVMTVAAQRGIAMGYRAAAGIVVCDTVLMLASTTGLASLLHTQPALFAVLKYVGGGYLSWLGLLLLRAAWGICRASRQGIELVNQIPLNVSAPFRTALAIGLTNPKAILFFISFFIQFVEPDYPNPALTFLILGVVVQMCSILYLTALIFGGVHLRAQVSRRPIWRAVGNALVGLLFIGFGLKLASGTLL